MNPDDILTETCSLSTVLDTNTITSINNNVGCSNGIYIGDDFISYENIKGLIKLKPILEKLLRETYPEDFI